MMHNLEGKVSKMLRFLKRGFQLMKLSRSYVVAKGPISTANVTKKLFKFKIIYSTSHIKNRFKRASKVWFEHNQSYASRFRPVWRSLHSLVYWLIKRKEGIQILGQISKRKYENISLAISSQHISTL